LQKKIIEIAFSTRENIKMADLNGIRKKLEKKILSGGHTFREISLKIGRKDSYIQQYIKYGFPKRLNEVDRKKVCQLLAMDESELIDDELSKSGVKEVNLIKLAEKIANPTDFLRIDIYDMKSSEKYEDTIIGQLAINYKEFFGWCNGNPENLKIMRLSGDNMEPTILSGSLIMYDTSILEYSGDGIYLIRYDDRLTLKRIQRTSNEQYILKSENPRYQDIRCSAEELSILGRAINVLTSRSL